MGAGHRISSAAPRQKANAGKRQGESAGGAGNATEVAGLPGSEQRTGDGCGQRQAIGQIRGTADASGGDGDRHALASGSAEPVRDPVGARAAAEHLCQLLAAAPALFVTASATTLLDLDQRITAVQRTDDGVDDAGPFVHCHQRRSGAISSSGRSLAATASRARKMRERTVPIGQSIMAAISS